MSWLAQAVVDGTGRELGHAGLGDYEEAAVLLNEVEAPDALLLGPADSFVSVDEFRLAIQPYRRQGRSSSSFEGLSLLSIQ